MCALTAGYGRAALPIAHCPPIRMATEKHIGRSVVKVVLPLALGVFVFYWVYRDFDFPTAWRVLRNETDWWWMMLSLVFGVLSHVVRGLRWRQMLTPLGFNPRPSHCIDAIYISYAANIVLPRVGEVSRSGILSHYDGVTFSKSLGTVVTERLTDALCLLVIAALTVALQFPLFRTFLNETGTKIPSLAHLLCSPWFYVSLFSVLAAVGLVWWLLAVFKLSHRVRLILRNVFEGVMSLRRVSNLPLFLFYTVAMWLCYYLHFYLTFRCFVFTESLGVMAGLVMFVAGTFAVIVPTPNGAGPWHFAVITMMMLYGVAPTEAGVFALIVHAVQTLLVIVLGLWGWGHVSFRGDP